LLRWSVLRIRSAMGVPVVWPSNTPDRISTWSASWRWVTWRLVPGRRRSRSGWMSLTDSAMPGGQPSITQPMAGPCDSPKLVTAKILPRVLPLMRRLSQAPARAYSEALGCWSSLEGQSRM
jgi:hypothetical protein